MKNLTINVGDYVRTINGEIYKLIDDFALIYFQKEQEYGLPEHQIIKSSPNIIDLIEVGDYVNGHRVIDIAKDQIRALYYEDINQKYALIPMINKDIKSIVTREMLESMEYKIGE